MDKVWRTKNVKGRRDRRTSVRPVGAYRVTVPVRRRKEASKEEGRPGEGAPGGVLGEREGVGKASG